MRTNKQKKKLGNPYMHSKGKIIQISEIVRMSAQTKGPIKVEFKGHMIKTEYCNGCLWTKSFIM